MTYGELIRKGRTTKHLTQGQLAEHLGVTISYVSDVERGRRKPWGEEVTKRVAGFLELDNSALQALRFEPTRSDADTLRALCRSVFDVVAGGGGELPDSLMVRLDQAGWPDRRP